MQRLPLHSGISVLTSKFILILVLPFLTFLVKQWGSRANNNPVLVLNAKGGEIKAKANGSATTCEISWGEFMTMGKRGSFWLLINFTLGLSLSVPKQVSLL
jgi:hypothetical protein